MEVESINSHFGRKFELLSEIFRNLVNMDFILIICLINNMFDLVFKLINSCLMIKLLLSNELHFSHSTFNIFIILIFFMELSIQKSSSHFHIKLRKTSFLRGSLILFMLLFLSFLDCFINNWSCSNIGIEHLSMKFELLECLRTE